jgi:hypothetical protein
MTQKNKHFPVVKHNYMDYSLSSKKTTNSLCFVIVAYIVCFVYKKYFSVS